MESPHRQKTPGLGGTGGRANLAIGGYRGRRWANGQDRRAELDTAKTNVGISRAWSALGLRGSPKPTCRTPWREDRHPSLSITGDRLWHDHATGDGGDVVSFVRHALRCTDREAINKVIELAGGQTIRKAQICVTARKVLPPQKTLKAPPLTAPTITTLAAYRDVRGWPLVAGMELAHQRGNLFACTITDNGQDRPALAMTDSARKSVQVRRVDGRPWTWNDAKAWTLGGSIAGWPIGCADIGEKPIVAFCEGGPDCLAALTLAFLHDIHDQVSAVYMPGATADILPHALTHFTGKRIRIFEHADKAGLEAGPRWASQLIPAGAMVDGFTFDPPYKDLADVLAATDAEHLDPTLNVFAGLAEGSKCL